MRLAIFGVAVVNNLRGRLIGPGHHSHSVWIWLEQHIAIDCAEQFPEII